MPSQGDTTPRGIDVRRKSGCGCLPGLLGIACIIALMFGLQVLGERVDAWRFPWGHPETGRKTLTGTWAGPVTTGSGQRLGMLISMHLAPLDSGRRRGGSVIRGPRSHWLAGRVLLCPRGGRMKRFTTWGKPDDTRTASRFHLALYPADSVPPDGLAPSDMKGRWAGGDSIAVSISLYLRKGKSAISATDDPDTGPDTPATLVRAAEADSASLCNR